MTDEQRQIRRDRLHARTAAAAPEMYKAIDEALKVFRLDGKIDGDKAEAIKNLLQSGKQRVSPRYS